MQAANLGNGYMSVSLLKERVGWESERSLKALGHMIKEGLAWVDHQHTETLYYFPSLFTADPSSSSADDNACSNAE